MEKIEKNQSTKTWDAIPEIGQYNVRYEEYTLKDPNIVNKLSQDKRPFLAYGEGPMIDCEFDDDSLTPDYLSKKNDF
ncbi:Hypothetical protein CINCED_3A005708 [Cinara cedri]|uniref:Uncharacterized protein n=1 Tax=Cinara cedri TaxID=506608 RepID=A0A5E4NP70_9HEMI|nr:Hypothetical protein CINCED_3A005708 [Cinara cedri]